MLLTTRAVKKNEYFQWKDAKSDTARELAVKFKERFPMIVRMAWVLDWAYAGWYVQMLGLAEKAIFPIAYSDWYHDEDPDWLPTTNAASGELPMPPGGEGEWKYS